VNMRHNSSDAPDPRASLPSAPSTEAPQKNFNDDFRLEIYPGKDGDWYHRLVSVHNGNVILDEGYRNKQDLVDLLERAFPEATIHEVPQGCSCGDTGWSLDENWQGEYPEDTRTGPGNGYIPCGFCNEGGWDRPFDPKLLEAER